MNTVKESIFKGIRNSNFSCSFIPDAYITKDGNCGVNVKNYHMRFHPTAIEDKLDHDIYNWLHSSFWNKVQNIGSYFGYDHVQISGRSDGWACPGNFYTDDQYGKRFYYVKPPYLNGKTDMPLGDMIVIERFNSFSFYVRQLHKMILVEMQKITTYEQLQELVKEIDSL